LTLLYSVAHVDKNEQDVYIYLRTLDSKKAEKLQKRISEHYPDVEILTHEIDEPVYFLNLEYIDGTPATFNAICPGEPENDPELNSDKVRITRRERLV
jgi:hypothetical protein